MLLEEERTDTYSLWHHFHSFPGTALFLERLLSNKQTEVVETSFWCKVLPKI